MNDYQMANTHPKESSDMLEQAFLGEAHLEMTKTQKKFIDQLESRQRILLERKK